jgi:hypothetical protein
MAKYVLYSENKIGVISYPEKDKTEPEILKMIQEQEPAEQWQSIKKSRAVRIIANTAAISRPAQIKTGFAIVAGKLSVTRFIPSYKGGGMNYFKKDEQGVCPVCVDGEIEYGAAEIDEGGVKCPWECTCGATGDEWHDMTFSEHTNVTDKDGKEYKPE